MSTPQIILGPRRAKPFYARHPWLFPGAIAEIKGKPADGAAVQLFSHGGSFIAHGLYNARSRIRVRLYSWELEQPLDETFFRKRLRDAISLRRDVLRLMEPGQACRLVFSEGDGLSGLTLDWYDGWLVVQFTSLALAQRQEMLVGVLQELLEPKGIYLRTERGIGAMEGVELKDGPLTGSLPPEPLVISEHGVRFTVNLAEGQKTGFYLDQHANRRAVARYAPGLRVLDAFSYTGGFGLHAAQAGAKEVLCVDGSEPAIALARTNAELNGLSQVQTERADVFEFLEQAAKDRRRFDLIVLDPPKFARNQAAIATALAGYRRLQALSFLLLEPGGLLVTCCCSGVVSWDAFQDVLAQVATEAKKSVQILERHGQPADHPIALACPETQYLKCIIARVL